MRCRTRIPQTGVFPVGLFLKNASGLGNCVAVLFFEAGWLNVTALRIPMKWGTDSDASGAASGRSDAGYSYDLRSAPLGSRFLWLVRAIAIGIISFPSSSSRLCFGIRVPIEVGRDFDQRWGTVSTGNGAQFRTKWGAVSTKVGQPIRCPTGGQSISGSDGSAGPTSVFGTEFAVCNQRFSISSILRRTWSQ